MFYFFEAAALRGRSLNIFVLSSVNIHPRQNKCKLSYKFVRFSIVGCGEGNYLNCVSHLHSGACHLPTMVTWKATCDNCLGKQMKKKITIIADNISWVEFKLKTMEMAWILNASIVLIVTANSCTVPVLDNDSKWQVMRKELIYVNLYTILICFVIVTMNVSIFSIDSVLNKIIKHVGFFNSTLAIDE